MVHEPTLADLIRDMWASKYHILIFGLLFAFLALIFILFSTPLYRASMIIAPADGYALGDYASSQTEGEALTIPFWRPREADGISTDFHRFVFTIQGPAVAAILMKDPSVISGIARDGSWSSKADDWSAEELADYLQKNIKVQHLGATPLRKISYRHPDPDFAAAFLRKAHLVADQLIRRDRRRQSETRIKYLETSLQKTANPDHRRGIASLLMQQEHIQMLANLDEPYAAIVVEPPASTPKPVWPDRMLLLAAFAVVGGGVGYATRALRRVR
jgi:LPS O-antigen subunit length determinant protein (WzzB/FepE family)